MVADLRERGSAAWWLERIILISAWLAAVGFMAHLHVFWRDEGRALSIALQGDDVVEMLGRLHGEGHPALWYLMLRGAYAVAGSSAVLHWLALAAIVPAVLMLAFASPLPFWLVTLILAGGPFLSEYPVLARNYGISAPLMFGIAALYPGWRERGVWLGLLAALLANTNVHSLLLAGAFLLLWLVDLISEGAFGRTRATWAWVSNVAVAAVGMGLSIAVLYPPVHDAVLPAYAPTIRSVLGSLLDPARRFEIVTMLGWTSALGHPVYPARFGPISWVMSAAMFGSVAGLARWPGGFAAGMAGLLSMSLLFTVVYPGSYRHQAIWLVFMIALYWMNYRRGTRDPSFVGRIGFACFALLLALQVPVGLSALGSAMAGEPPFSQVRNLALALQARADLRGAILIPDPDSLLEAYPAYADNPIYLPRARAFGKVSRFTRAVATTLSLADLLDEAQLLCRQAGVPVVLVIEQELTRATLPARFAEGFGLALMVDQASFDALRRSTEPLGRFAPARSDEAFDAYALKPPCVVDWSG